MPVRLRRYPEEDDTANPSTLEFNMLMGIQICILNKNDVSSFTTKETPGNVACSWILQLHGQILQGRPGVVLGAESVSVIKETLSIFIFLLCSSGSPHVVWYYVPI